jgi:hypothetical protein
MEKHRRPEIFNTDQGVQFTTADFLARLEAQGVRISTTQAVDHISTGPTTARKGFY